MKEFRQGWCAAVTPATTKIQIAAQRISSTADILSPRRAISHAHKTKFREDLVAQVKKWREECSRLIVCLDANKYIYKKSIGKALTDIDGLAMREVVGDFTRQPVGPTYFQGSTPINGV